jgi:hypothetical protein
MAYLINGLQIKKSRSLSKRLVKLNREITALFDTVEAPGFSREYLDALGEEQRVVNALAQRIAQMEFATRKM